MEITSDDFRSFTDLKIAACGTAWHAALVAKYLIEELARLPVEVDYASEFRYRDPILSDRTLMMVISQSGETADTLAALREAKGRGCKTLAICNVQGSMITREADGTIYTHATGDRRRSAKAFLLKWSRPYLLALHLAEQRGRLSNELARDHVRHLSELPVKMRHCSTVTSITRIWPGSSSGRPISSSRRVNFPVARGALKLKGISTFAEGYAAGEMKHGQMHWLTRLPVVVINTRSENAARLRYEDALNIQEVKARGGSCFSVVTEGMSRLAPPQVCHRSAAVERATLTRIVDRPTTLAYHSRAPWLRRRSASQPGEVGDCRIASFRQCGVRQGCRGFLSLVRPKGRG
jgi:glucosamine--fructose-6-phosphate aminotransferase (isomerizing)